MKIRFLGAAGGVTGSRTLLESGGHRILVDCGMFQGFKASRKRNWQPLELPAASIDAVVLTHAHLDHSGWLPALVRDGFEGPILCTQGTADLLGVLLPDSGRIQEEDALRASRKRSSRHSPPLPLYTEQHAYEALSRVRPVPRGELHKQGPFSFRLHRAGHILGASSVWVSDGGRSLLLSGDLGRDSDLLMLPPEPPPQADHVVIESTYGDRLHPAGDLLSELAAVVHRTADRGGVVLIPSFAVGRTQSLLWAIHQLKRQGRIPDLPVALDSPMATNATELTLRHSDELRLTHAETASMCDGVQFVRSRDESRALNEVSGPMIIIAASGMLTGGRVLGHLGFRAPAYRNTLLFVGFQAAGTRGARLVEGQDMVKVYGRYVHVRCEVTQITGFSAHADQGELLAWLERMPEPPVRVWLNHGEPVAGDTLRQLVESRLGWPAQVATEGVEWDLEALAPLPLPPTVPAAVAPASGTGWVLAIGDPNAPALRELRQHVRAAGGLGGEPVTVTSEPRPNARLSLKAVVAFPGGYNMLAKLFVALDQLQKGVLPPSPVVLVGDAFWDQHFHPDRLVADGLLESGEAARVFRVQTVGEVLPLIERWSQQPTG